ncbi:hypothetical protein [Mycobacterium sp. E735]|uniref:hypothetical protein n=1 Tax=Mycobacterium sp. E735 TaxID=1834148 RepID=UPI0007FDB6C1|nr:hypothetical protein [Mycobacterium sp. E735]OBG63321.1 hypothetical protein A5704_02020 [Mycobacterium sp. E735]
MSALLIGYDLNKPGQDYDKLFEKIKGLGAWWHYLDSTWIVDTTLTPREAFDDIKPTLDDSDRLLIVNITSDTYTGFLPQNAWDWLNAHV